MSLSLGELFVQLGVVGDVKPLENAIKKTKEQLKLIDNEISANKRLLTYLNALNNARNKGEKAIIKENFVNEIKKQKLLDEISVGQKNIETKKESAKQITRMVKGIAGFVTAVSGAIWAVSKLTNQLIESNQAFLNLTRTSDISLNTFQKWGSVGKMLGVQNAAQQIEGLNEKLFELQLTGEGARGFQLAGINPMGQDAEGVLEQIRARIKGMNDTAASYLLKQMGLDPQMLHILRMSREEFEALNQEMAKYRLTPEQRASIQQMNIQIQIASQKLQYLKERAILEILPAWVKFVQSLARVTEGLAKAVKWIKDGKTATAATTKTILACAAAIGILKVALWALTAHPVIAGITALIGALYLLVDDIVAYNTGKDSLIGTMINGLKDLDLKGFLDFPVPKWLEKLIKVINFFTKDRTKKHKIIEEIDPDEKPTKYSNGNTGSWGDNTSDKIGYNPNMFLSPGVQQNVTNNDNRTANANTSNVLNQNIQIYTEQPAQAIGNELTFANYAFTA